MNVELFDVFQQQHNIGQKFSQTEFIALSNNESLTTPFNAFANRTDPDQTALVRAV